MKNKFLSILAVAAAAVTFTACDEETEGLTRITYYPSIELEGESYMVIQKGAPYVEPGYTSLLNGEDVTAGVTVSGSVDVNQSGIYTLTYTTIDNEDGFGASATRTVVVLDLTNPIEGFYTSVSPSQRSDNGVAFGGYTVLVYQRADGHYSVDDLLGGWYRDRAGYGDNYALRGVVDIADDGTISLLASGFSAWPYTAEVWADGFYDAAEGTLFWRTGFQGLTWDVKLAKD